jgi:hypothetical protein
VHDGNAWYFSPLDSQPSFLKGLTEITIHDTDFARLSFFDAEATQFTAFGRQLGPHKVDFIAEHEIPSPEITHELPNALIGEFIMVSHIADYILTIYENNKYILEYELPHHPRFYYHGHITNTNGAWFLFPVSGQQDSNNRFNRPTEIFLSDTGFSVYNMRAMRKENIPRPINRSEEI